MARGAWILPLASRDEVAAELADTERRLRDGLSGPLVDRGRFDEWRLTMVRWRGRLAAQLAEMDEVVA